MATFSRVVLIVVVVFGMAFAALYLFDRTDNVKSYPSCCTNSSDCKTGEFCTGVDGLLQCRKNAEKYCVSVQRSGK